MQKQIDEIANNKTYKITKVTNISWAIPLKDIGKINPIEPAKALEYMKKLIPIFSSTKETR